FEFLRVRKEARNAIGRGARLLAAALLVAGLGASAPARADGIDAALRAVPLEAVFPGAGHAGVADGTPPSAPVFVGQRLAGYVFLTSQVVDSAGYAGRPVKILAGLDLDGRITGAVVVEHQEPILALGIDEAHLHRFLDQMRGLDVRRRVRLGPARGGGETGIDGITGATITSMVFSDSVVRSARAVGRARGIIAAGSARRGTRALDLETFREAWWQQLLDDGSIHRLLLTNAQVDQAFRDLGGALPGTTHRRPDDTYIDLYVALATPPAVGQNLLGFAAYGRLRADLEPGAQAIFVGAAGFYSFRGYAYRRSGVFDRLQLVQDSRTIPLTRDMHRRLDKLAIANAPDLRETSLFIIPPATGFDATRPWRLELLAERTTAGVDTRYVVFPLAYEVPAALLLGGGESETAATDPGAAEDSLPLWHRRWLESTVHVTVLSVAIAILLAVLVFQDWVTAHPRFLGRLRVGFLLFTLGYLGWMQSAQLSVINVLTFINALLTGFRWEFFLLEPMIFLLWSFVAVALLFWGRGVFCGWLCPFGALQELLNRGARALRLRQVSLPFAVHERLWPLKYVIFLGLLAVSLGPFAMTTALAEVEPFKTAISLKFLRPWPFVAYAAGLLVLSLFVQRVFCRYLCPLGGALALPSRTRMFEWLKRRRQCGTECHICAVACPVQAIHPDGAINPHECIYCLDCQRLYHDDHKCPPLIERRKRREARRERRRLAAQGGPT
ncbi:MAG: regulatory protein NosR, partial [Rhodobacterales bacterium]|nr:regulatory protein NosR [Rhodobacterales bacterium]